MINETVKSNENHDIQHNDSHAHCSINAVKYLNKTYAKHLASV